jgi:hypothetical protein
MTKLFLRVIVTSAVILSSCSEELPDYCADPLGSDTKTYNNQSVMCFKEDFNGCFVMDFNTTPKIRAVQISNGEVATIADAGEISCLNSLTGVSMTYSYEAVVAEHHGYVVKFPDGTVGRIFIESITTVGSKFDQINVLRQYPFNE